MPKEIDGVTYFTADEVYKTQDEVDRIVSDRLARDRRERPEKPADYDQLKTRAAELETKVSELETARQQAVEAARTEAAQEVTQKYAGKVLDAEIRAAAIAKGFRDPADVLTQIGDTADLWGEDGSLNAEALAERVGSIATAKPYLLNAEPAPVGAGDVGIGSSSAPAAPEVAPGADRLASYYNTAPSN